MDGLVYAAVAYVRNPVGAFVEELRRELHPAHTHADAHLTILPPRPLRGTEQEAIDTLTEVCSATTPFEVTLGDVETFIPVTPTVFLRVAHAAYRMRELHDRANRESLEYVEPWPYMPHLTIAKMDTIEEARKVVEIVRGRWDGFRQPRKATIDALAFVKGNGDRWVDLQRIPMGPAKRR